MDSKIELIPLLMVNIKFMQPQIQKLHTIKKDGLIVAELNPQQFAVIDWTAIDRKQYQCIEEYAVFRKVRIFGNGGKFYNSIFVEKYCSSLDDAKKYINDCYQ
jgi:hypothetical protein